MAPAAKRKRNKTIDGRYREAREALRLVRAIKRRRRGERKTRILLPVFGTGFWVGG